MKAATGFLIRLYRNSPLYPSWGKQLAKLLHFVSSNHGGSPFVYDTEHFRINIDLNQIIDSQIYYTDSFEPKAEKTIRRILRKDAVAVDIGANIGSLTLFMASCVESGGKIIAFEPTQWAYERLVANVGLNDMPQVTVERLGLSDHSAEGVEVSIQSSYRIDGANDASKELIDITTLDVYFEKNPINRLDLIKIDTDGMELDIFRGGENTLRQFKPALLFELGPDGLAENNTTPAQLLEFLRAQGYEFYHEANLAPFTRIEERASQLSRQTSFNVVALTRLPGQLEPFPKISG